eukprot:TRINITY_DN7051_c0_g1_i1.p1 TRINITY_DN7051_c0_g1~~TRINITY_DN7051_c0_g1_i1.p1  ORF type:complete len:373 (+),score=61.88 TRINITY_DN7051_c0_g1_i1:23-1141(+)
MASEFWIVTAPSAPRPDATFSRHDQKTHRDADLATNYVFSIPNLRIGTMDQLMSLSDDLHKIDLFVESVYRKFERQLFDMQGNEDIPTVDGKKYDVYLTKFKWDEAKFPINRSLRELTERLQTDIGHYDEGLKKRTAEYIAVRTQLSALARRDTGNLGVRDLAPFVKKENWLETETLTTLLVAVPRFMYKQWQTKYETMTKWVMPRSSQGPLSEDTEYGLFTVVLFRRDAEEFRRVAREARFTVREFRFDEALQLRSEQAKEKLVAEEKNKKSQLVTWLQNSYGEVFLRWIHLKAMRAFVESVLRYGLPPDFAAILMEPKKKNERRLRDELKKLYGHLGGGTTDDKDEDAASAAEGEFYPYVYLQIVLRRQL